MPDTTTLLLFMGAALALLVVPGPAVLYIVARSIEGGTRAGLVSILGIHCGSLVHIAAASLGISSLLVSSALAFNVVKYLGAAYLVFLGIRTLLRREQGEVREPRQQARRRRIFGEGIVVNVLNPKTALFFFAFLPQFVDVEQGHVGLQMLVLGLVFVVLGLVSDGAWAVAAGVTAERLRTRAGFLRARRWVSGGVYLGLGLVTAFSGHRARATH
jgi:threonine/homoserine/homoserine lactone efflux protein